MNEETKGQAGLSGGIAGAGQLLAAQYDAQATYRREKAVQIALQAHGGNGPYPVTELLKDADAIMTWLEPKPAP
jgi:3-hydroxyisobutyrate dehydrogenase-like beta-hydroxyacid dehydrogenase